MLNKAVKTLKKQKKIEYAEHCNIAVTEFLNGLLDSENQNATEMALIVSQLKKEIDIMPNIRKRKNGLLEGRLCFKGKYFSVYARNLTDLKIKIKRKFKELEKEYKQIKTLAYTKKDWITLEGYYQEWLENDKKPFVSKATYTSIINAFEKHILLKLGKLKLKELSKSIIQRFLNGYENTRRKELIITYFKACITQAHKERLIEHNPFDTVIVQKKIKADKKGFTCDEQERILKYLKISAPTWYNIILCYLCLGCRRSELFSIKTENIKNGLVLIQGTKTEKSTRYINISTEFEKILLETIPFFPKTEMHWITTKFRKILNELKIKGSLHSLRHSFITNHYYLGTPAKQVQAWVGHSSIQMTMDIYTNIDPQINAKEEKNKLLKLYNNLYYYTN